MSSDAASAMSVHTRVHVRAHCVRRICVHREKICSPSVYITKLDEKPDRWFSSDVSHWEFPPIGDVLCREDDVAVQNHLVLISALRSTGDVNMSYLLLLSSTGCVLAGTLLEPSLPAFLLHCHYTCMLLMRRRCLDRRAL